jgi:hypothetical protein
MKTRTNNRRPSGMAHQLVALKDNSAWVGPRGFNDAENSEETSSSVSSYTDGEPAAHQVLRLCVPETR